MNIGLIGFGYWGKNIYRNLVNSDQIDKIYILDINTVKLNKTKKLLIYSNPKEFFNNNNGGYYLFNMYPLVCQYSKMGSPSSVVY